VVWVQQGGFAGDNLVAPEHRLEKFAGRLTCASFNPGGAPKQTLELLADDRFARRTFVSKNVCHGVVWNETMHAQLSTIGTNIRPGLRWMIHGLDRYLQDKGVGKAMHDLVAAAVALEPSVCTFKEVEIYREKGEWGANEKAGTGTFISVAYDPAKFLDVLGR
jgi:pyrimidine-specific ribonucleoside hydrolase